MEPTEDNKETHNFESTTESEEKETTMNQELSNTQELKTIIYKLARENQELSEQEKEIVDKIVEEKDYSE